MKDSNNPNTFGEEMLYPEEQCPVCRKPYEERRTSDSDQGVIPEDDEVIWYVHNADGEDLDEGENTINLSYCTIPKKRDSDD